MSQLLTVDEPVQAEMRSTTLLLGGSQFPQFSRRLSELLAESGQHVVEGRDPGIRESPQRADCRFAASDLDPGRLFGS